MATRSTPLMAGIDEGSRAAALTSQPSLARAKAKRLPMKPEAPVMSTRPFNSASFGKGEESDAGGHEAEADA